MSEPSAAPDRCPRCGGTFACGAAGPAPCVCTTLHLDAALQARLRERFVGCLCMACLHELVAGGPLGGRAATAPEPAP